MANSFKKAWITILPFTLVLLYKLFFFASFALMTSLTRTGKFNVWDFGIGRHEKISNAKIQKSQSQPSQLNSSTKSYESTPLMINSGKRFTLCDLARVAVLRSEVVLDIEVPKSEEIPEETTLQQLEIADSNYNNEICRGGLFFLLSTLLQNRSCRFLTLQGIIQLLNSNIIPRFTSDETAGAELAFVLTGGDFPCFVIQDSTIQVSTTSETDFRPFPLTPQEHSLLSSNRFLLSGAASLISFGALSLSTSLDLLTSLSCEVAGVDWEAMDPALFETHRQHRGQIVSCTNLRLLLEGSKRTPSVNPSLTRAERSLFESLPQSSGPVLEACLAAHKTMELELNSAEPSPSSPSFLPFQSQLALQTLSPALRHLSSASEQRQAILRKVSSLSNSSLSSGEGWESAVYSESIVDGWVALTRASASLSNEISFALTLLNSFESPSSSPPTTDSKDEEGPAKESKKPVQDESHLTPEQRKKAEAARKKKEEKAAAKKAEKDAKKAAAGGSQLVLGAGTSQLRAALNSLQTPQIEIDPFEQSESSALSPSNSSSINFPLLSTRLLEQLSSGGNKRKLKIAKGARDFTPDQMRIREQVFGVIKKVFKRHGGVEIDTPVFELKEVLTGKYGEDSKLIYDLADQGGELLALRYDLTVPFARFLAMNSVGNIKRYHIAKVYRRDQPQVTRGRFREFYQCDFDVAGSYSLMVADSEVITVAVEILNELPVGDFLVKLNHRKILDSIFEICGVPAEKFRPICSAVDKLDKSPWSQVKEEMVFEKGLSEEVADRIGEFVLHQGEPRALWEKLTSSRVFGDHTIANEAMRELSLLFDYLDATGALPRVSFDLSLARGLDYYTGVIYEVVLTSGTSQVGSIAAGGRYDNLVGMFSSSGTQTPCVGVSIGVERVFTIMETKAAQLKKAQAADIQVFVASIGSDLLKDRMRVARLLWAADISAEYSHLPNPKLVKQLDDVLERGIPFMLVFGSDELKRGSIKLKNIFEKTEEEILLSEVVEKLTSLGCKKIQSGVDQTLIEQMRTL